MIPDPRLPPHSEEAEQGVLGSVLQDPPRIAECMERINSSAFYDLRHQIIFSTMTKMSDAGQPIDTLTLWDALKNSGQIEQVGGIAYLNTLPEKSPSAYNLPHYIGILREKETARAIIRVCTELTVRAYDPVNEPGALLDGVEQALLTLARHREGGATAILTSKQMVREVLDQLQAAHEGTAKGISTGLADLDKVTGGLKMGQYWIIAARPSMGKSSLIAQMLDAVCVEQRAPAGIFSLEMSAAGFGGNMVHSRARINNRALQYTEGDFSRLFNAAGKIGGAPFEICTKSDLSIRELRAIARQMKARTGAKVFAVDYLQLASSQTKNGENREREIAQVSNGLKNMAKELDACVICACQLNRQGDTPGQVPQMSWIRESGQIEADADFIGALYYPQKDNTDAINLYVLKQRSGPRYVKIELLFIKEHTRFEAVARHIDEEDVPQPQFFPD